jgi:transmembrane 9 superfamily protein 2/4
MSFFSIIFSSIGFLSPANRGALVMAQLLIFVLMGSVAGYTTARLYKAFKGKAWQLATALTAFLYPGLFFSLFIILNIVARIQESTDAVPFGTMVVLLVLWFGISTPLVFFGAYFGYRQESIDFPTKVSSIPRQIPDQPWYMGLPFTVAVGGILPFGTCFVALYFLYPCLCLGESKLLCIWIFITYIFDPHLDRHRN